MTNGVLASKIMDIRNNLMDSPSFNTLGSYFTSGSMANSAMSQSYANTQMGFQERMQRQLMSFNASEAAKNREWQEYMSNTAHQREVRDLLAAGLNPVLSAGGGNGAAVGSGATASVASAPSGAKGDVDTTANTAIVSLLGSLLMSRAQTQAAETSANANLAIAERTNATQKLISELNGMTSIEVAKINKMASALIAGGMVGSANITANASKYVADTNSSGNIISLIANGISGLLGYDSVKDATKGLNEYFSNLSPADRIHLYGSVR